MGAGIVHHMSRHELANMPNVEGSMAHGENREAIEMDGGVVDLEKGESSNGGLGPAASGPSKSNASGSNVTSAAVEVEWQQHQSTPM